MQGQLTVESGLSGASWRDAAAWLRGSGVAIVVMAVIFLLLQICFACAASNTGRDYKMAGDATKMRVVLNFDREPEPRWFLLRGPHRLVIDLPETQLVLDPKALKARGLVKSVRYGATDPGTTRLVLSTKGPFAIDKLDILPNDGGAGYRIAIDMSAASEKEFETALAVQSQTTGATAAAKGDPQVAAATHDDKRFVVVIDAGHGGIDTGAKGLNGTEEKGVTLTFARELRDKLTATGKYVVHMTRDSDEFLRLDDRVRIARQHGADLFISVHADTIRLKGIRGATVYTVSDKASDAEAQALADRENLSDQLGGIEIRDDNQQVADILVDLIRRETHGFSLSFANSLVGELADTVGMINNPHRSAGFVVLKAPDVPSVLVELGYLSNAKDEEQLLSAEWRAKAADSIVRAIATFAAAKGSTGG